MRFSLPLYLTAALLWGATSLPAHAQVEPIKFGKPDAKDFEARSFVADSAAEAVILCDYGRSRFDVGSGDFKIVFDRVVRIKILKKAGYDWATVQVPLYKKDRNEEKLTNLRGFTYNMVNGQLTKDKLEPSGVFTEQRTANNFIRKFTLPNVREGSVIEFAYSINSDFLFNFQDWQFQHAIPVRWSEYRASIPEYFDYKMLMQGYEPLAVQERTEGTGQFTLSWRGSDNGQSGWSGNTRNAPGSATVTPRMVNHRWAMKEVPALKDEPFMTTAADYVARIEFELAGYRWPNQAYQSVAGSWEKINSSLLEDDNFGGQLKRGSFLKEKLTPLLAKTTDPAERVALVHQFVRQAVKFNGRSGIYSNTTIRKAYEQHTGNDADINLLLIALLREAGLEANPVLLSTRDHGRVNVNSPLLSKFNYVVAHVALPENKELLVDATDELLPCGTLPTHCLSGQGRLIMPQAQNSRWVDLQPAQRYVGYRQVNLVLDERGTITGTVHQEHGGYEAHLHRERLRKQGEKKFMEELAKGHESWTLGKYAFKQQDDLHKPLALDYEFTVAGAEAPVTALYLNPLRDFDNAKNPFLHEDRHFPVDFGAALDETTVLTITLPAGFVADELPKQVVVDMPENGGRFTYNVVNNGSTLQIMSRSSLRKPVYSAAEYAQLREFYSRMLAKHAEQIVLKKKS